MVASEASWSGPSKAGCRGEALVKTGGVPVYSPRTPGQEGNQDRELGQGRRISTGWMKRWLSHESEFGGFRTLEDLDA